MSNINHRVKRRPKKTRLSREDKLRDAVAANTRRWSGPRIWLAVDNGAVVNRLHGQVQPFVQAVENTAAFLRRSLCENVKTCIDNAGLEAVSGGDAFNKVLNEAANTLIEAAKRVRVRRKS